MCILNNKRFNKVINNKLWPPACLLTFTEKKKKLKERCYILKYHCKIFFIYDQ